ncbi:BQ2448_5390 [Microbotryum intermedium]|uniref:Conserved oligomeric Golgi complex subunit 8 n=1 Tax=Microbotryum intermedium TaxID=269621 RepID=A0A238F4Z7_9BASI|nr:BQ2448_5390 [Microbotryum intermedium]
MAAAASSSAQLGSLLEESPVVSQLASTSASPKQLDAGTTFDTDNVEPLPTLSSLLLSTAKSLVECTDAINSEPSRVTQTASTSATRLKPPGAVSPVASTSKAIASPTASAFGPLHPNPVALLSDPSSNEYLASLLAMPLSTLQSLPATLAAISKSLDTDLSSLAFTRYSAFLLTHSATQSISQSFTTLSDSLTALLESTSELEAAAAAFEQRVDDVRRKRDRTSRVQERIDEVEELLEAPAVVEACVRAGYWGEAIDVAARLSELHERLKMSKDSKRYKSTKAKAAQVNGTVLAPPEATTGDGALRLLQRIRDDVAIALLSLRARVIDSLLQRGLKLPGAVRGIGTLRRIGSRGISGSEPKPSSSAAANSDGPQELDENALRVVFLAARWRCLRSELEAVEGQMMASGIKIDDAGGEPPEATPNQTSAEENDERMKWTRQWIDTWREVVGETLGMYTDVFLSSSVLSDQAATKGSESTPNQLNCTLSAAAPLALFATSSLTSLSGTLARAIPSLTSTAYLAGLLTQLSYCSHSFARYGLEFRELQQLRERIEARVGRIVVLEWEAAGRAWEKEWRDGWEGTGSHAISLARRASLLGGRAPMSDWLAVPEGLSQVFATPMPPALPADVAPSTFHHQPPHAIALLPPLARFLNAHAIALNSLRFLPPLALYPSLRVAQARELDRATQVLAAFTDAWLATSHGAAASGRDSLDVEEDDAHLSNDERKIKALRVDEKRLIVTSIAWFGRWVVPWIEGSLDVGIYGEVTAQNILPKERRVAGVVDAVKRTEGLIARIEGRRPEPEAIVPEGSAGDDSKVAPVDEMATMPVEGTPVNPAIVEPVLDELSDEARSSIGPEAAILNVPNVAPPTAESIGA